MSEFIKRIGEYLKKMNLKYEWIEEKEHFEVPYKIEGHDHSVIISIVGKWIYMRSGILQPDKIPQAKETELYKTLLHSNHTVPEICYDMDDQGYIGTSQEILASALSFDVFEEEFFAIPYAISHFWKKIVPKFE